MLRSEPDKAVSIIYANRPVHLAENDPWPTTNSLRNVINSFSIRNIEGENRQYSMHTSLFFYVINFILFCKLCYYIMQIVI